MKLIGNPLVHDVSALRYTFRLWGNGQYNGLGMRSYKTCFTKLVSSKHVTMTAC